MGEQQINLNPVAALNPHLTRRSSSSSRRRVSRLDDDKIRVDLSMVMEHTHEDYRLLRVQYGSYHMMGNLGN